MKEFNSSAEVNAYIQKQATIVKDVLAKLEAVSQELKTAKAKFSTTGLAKGYNEESTADFEKQRKSALTMLGYCERYLTEAKDSGADALKLFVH